MTARSTVTLREAVRVWAYIGLNSFGGPAGQIAVMHREVVERRRWISESRFLHALNFVMLLPGPEAQQLATYLGWVMHGVRGGVIAGALFIVPGVIVMLGLSIAYVIWGQVAWVSGLLTGLQAAVIALVVTALVRLSRRSLTTGFLRLVAIGAFLGIAVLLVPFPVIILAAGVVGWAVGRRLPGSLARRSPASDDAADDDEEVLSQPAARGARCAAATAVVLWLAPVVALFAVLGSGNVFAEIAGLFSKAAVVTFGGAYAVLAYVAQQAVADYGWISADDMVVGLGLAETTPGPLILVVQFVGFLAAYGDPGTLPPMLAGVLGALLAVWVTFLPCFAFIFAGAPYVERLRHSEVLRHALAGIGAAVVGVIGSLALAFALATLFASVDVLSWGPLHVPLPDVSTIRLVPTVITGAALVLVLRLRTPTLAVLGICSGLGALAAVLPLP